MGGQAGQKFECNDKFIDIQNRLSESQTEGFTGLPPTYREIVMGNYESGIKSAEPVLLCIGFRFISTITDNI